MLRLLYLVRSCNKQTQTERLRDTQTHTHSVANVYFCSLLSPEQKVIDGSGKSYGRNCFQSASLLCVYVCDTYLLIARFMMWLHYRENLVDGYPISPPLTVSDVTFSDVCVLLSLCELPLFLSPSLFYPNLTHF